MSDNVLSAKVKHRIGAVTVDLDFVLTKPWTVLFGPSGSGKTTVLRAIAGFILPEAGRIEAGKNILFDSLTKTSVPAHRRPVRSSGQMAQLFPHMTVQRNISYGAGQNVTRDDVGDITKKMMASFRLSHLADKMPHELSGGEKQRVSVARTMVSTLTFGGLKQMPLLLLDEPLSGLDAATRDEVLCELRQWTERWRIPVLSVTHSIGEAFQLGADVIKIAEGRIVQQGPVSEVLAIERTRLLNQLS